jgi:thiol:disulfide interchange protein DsbC
MLRPLIFTACLSVASIAASAQPAPPAPVPAAASAATPEAAPDPRIALLKLLPAGSKLEDMRPAPIAGIYEFSQGADVSYITADGKFFLDGNVYDMHSRENLTEQVRTHARLTMINAVPESQMLIFSPPNPKYTITVFTDVDCQYCRKLHSEIGELNKLGIRVRYMFFPRTGPNTESWHKAEVVWCSPDRNDTFTRAKLGAPLDLKKVCPTNPVAREYQLGQDIGVRGTPAIVTERGDYIAGYLPPMELLAQLKELQAPGTGVAKR